MKFVFCTLLNHSSFIYWHRENAKKLLYENETLQDELAQAEKDTVQVISFLKSEDLKKEEQVNSKSSSPNSDMMRREEGLQWMQLPWAVA